MRRDGLGAFLAGVALGGATMALMIGGRSAAADKGVDWYRPDEFLLVDGCVGRQRIYFTPNGRFWVWQGRWLHAPYRTSDDC